jgi:hypothetical protein
VPAIRVSVSVDKKLSDNFGSAPSLFEFSEDSVHSSSHTVLMQAPFVRLVLCLNVGFEPVREKTGQVFSQPDIALLESNNIFLDLLRQFSVLDSVRSQLRISCLLHHHFFVHEVIANIGEEPAQQIADGGARLALHHGFAKIIDGVEQNGVLDVNSSNSDGKLVSPGHEGHRYLLPEHADKILIDGLT